MTVYESIKKMLMELRFPPGSLLRERTLAEMLGVSRTPIREALQCLSHEGWVQVGNGKRIVVCPVKKHDVVEIFQIRAIIEPCATKEALASGSAKMLAGKLDAVNNAMCQMRHSHLAFVQLDLQFHAHVVASLANERMSRFWVALHEEIIRIALMTLEDGARLQKTMDEHAALIDALWKKDADAINNAVLTHLNNSRDALLSRMQDDPEPAVLESRLSKIYAMPDIPVMI